MMCQMSLHKGVPPTPSYLPRKFFRLPTKTPPGIAQLALAVGVPVPATVVGECVAVGPGRNPPSKARALAAAVLREGPLPLSDEGVGRSPIRGPSGPPARVSVIARARAFVRRKCDGGDAPSRLGANLGPHRFDAERPDVDAALEAIRGTLVGLPRGGAMRIITLVELMSGGIKQLRPFLASGFHVLNSQ
jgi:hypothetical protein